MKSAITVPSRSPASSCRKWPAPVSTGWSMPAAPGTVRLSTGAIDRGDRIAIAKRHQERLGPGGQAPPGRPVSLRGRVVRGCRHQLRHGPDRRREARVGERRLIGGDDRRRKRRLAAGLHQPRHAQRGRGPDDLTEAQPDLGHRVVPGGQPGVGRDHPGEPVRMFRHQAQADQAAPVLPDDGQAAQVKMIKRERPDPLHVTREAVIADVGWLVRPAEPGQVRGDRMQPGVREHGHHLAVQERPARLAVQQQHRLAVGRTCFGEGQPQVTDLGVAGRVAEVRQVSEPVVGGA